MPTSLSKDHRKLLEKATAAARVLAESACRAALENLAVHEKAVRSHMSEEQKRLRNSLRARGRALGDKRDERTGIQDIPHLTELAAYEHWHRLLFTRFLTENHLLITDEANGSVPVTLEECEELAPELGARDGLDLACRFASLTLPGVFRRDDPVLDLPIALNDQVELRKLLAALPTECFLADDALGWTYQFWQAQRKDEVNASGKKIGADELAPVTQLFTEDYIVAFLLHNTLGAWWAGKLGPIRAASEEEARAHAALGAKDGVPAISWTYLRFVQDEPRKTWLPAAGTFEGWPKTANLIRLLDPCMGSGHFLAFALPMLARLRMEEEKLSAQKAVVAVITDNIHGLELDERCTQIAAFNVALTAWKLAGYQSLSVIHLACSGLAPNATETEWVALAGNNDRLQRGMARLYMLFKAAPVLGSLINPRTQGGSLVEADFHELQPLLEKALAQEGQDEISHELAVTARGLAKAAEILAGQFNLVATNVPYLGRGKQADVLQEYCEQVYAVAKGDLATCFMERCLDLCMDKCSVALLVPWGWTFATNYQDFREGMLRTRSFCLLAKLGEGGFESAAAAGAFVVAPIITKRHPHGGHTFITLDVSKGMSVEDKNSALGKIEVATLLQADQLSNPDSRILFEARSHAPLLALHAQSLQGIKTGDDGYAKRVFWELPAKGANWKWFQSTVDATREYGGCEFILRWEGGGAEIARLQGQSAWGKRGVAVSLMRELRSSLYFGEVFDSNVAAVVLTDRSLVLPLWLYCQSGRFSTEVRVIDPRINAMTGSLTKVPFDLAHWQKVAAEKYPDGLPKPHSDDPTQWLFSGHPKGSDQPLHVAVARLLDYRWPRQTGSSFLDCPALDPDGLESFGDKNGIVCLPPLNREQPAAARLRQILTAALGTFNERALIAGAGLKGSKSNSLEDWLRDEFFEQHTSLFHENPFIWHLWDGRSDGFHALVNYHRLDHATLQKLAYSHLGDWIRQQDEDAKADKPGAAARLGAARALQTKLAAILEGEKPLDIFIRWKPLKDQASGWHPDLNDGVRQNLRPFLLAGDVGKKGAGVFRSIPLALKDKDRGNEPNRPKKDYPWFWCEEGPGTDPTGSKEFVGNRWNNVHLTLARKQQAKA